MLTRISHALLFALIVIAPFGTRWIIDTARIGEVAVESATHGLFVTQIVALAVAAAVLYPMRRSSAARLMWPGKLALLLFALAAFSAAFAPDAAAASATVVRLGVGVALFIAVSRADMPIRHAAWALLLMAALQATLGLLQFSMQTVAADTMVGVASQSAADAGTSVVETGEGRWLRAYGTLPHPNVLGFVAAIGVLVGAWLMVEMPRPFLAAALTAISTLGLFASFSRSALLALLFGSAVLYGEAARLKPSRKRYLAAAGLVAAMAVLAVVAVPDAWLTRAGADPGRLEVASVSERKQSLVNGTYLAKEAPLLGVGPGLMPFALAERFPYRDVWSHQPAHAVPILVAAEVGVPAMLVWLFFIAALLAVGIRAHTRSATVPLVALLVAVFVASLFDHYFWTTWPGQLMFWLLTGLLWGELRLSYAKPKTSTPKKA